MPLNIADAENGILEAQAQIKTWSAEFIAEWFKPLRDTIVAVMWSTLTPEQHLVLQQRSPEAYEQVKQMMELKRR